MSPPVLRPSMFALLGGAMSLATLAGAFYFQYVVGLPPCALCYWQRYAHGAIIAAALLAWGLPRRWSFAVLGLAALGSAGVAGFHSGVERAWWPGLASCSAVSEDLTGLGAADLLSVTDAPAIVRCDEIPWTLAGLSMANYNVLISLGLAALALYALRRIATAS